MRISDWSSDVCSSDLASQVVRAGQAPPPTTATVQAGLFPAGLIEQLLRQRLVLAIGADVHGIFLEVAAQIRHDLRDLDALARRAFVVAAGEVLLGVVAGAVCEDLDRLLLVRSSLQDAAAGVVAQRAPPVLV